VSTNFPSGSNLLLYLFLCYTADSFSKPKSLTLHHRDMKGIDIFCASQASTAICLSMDEPSSSISNTAQFGGRAIDRHNPIITDPRRTPSRDFIVPSSSPKPHIDSKPLHDHLPKPKKNSTSKPSGQKKKHATKGLDQKKKSSVEKLTEHITNNYSSKPIDSVLRRSWARPPTDLITPPGSSRYLLSDMPSFHGGSSLYDPVLALTNVDKEKAQVLHHDKPSSSSSLPKSASSDQVQFLYKTYILFLRCCLNWNLLPSE